MAGSARGLREALWTAIVRGENATADRAKHREAG